MNYEGLKTAVADWLHRDGTSQIPTFIELATARISTDVRVAQMESRATRTATSEYVGLPSDFSSIRYVTIDGKRADFKRPELVVDYAANGWSGDPGVYTITDNQIRLCPAPTSTAPKTIEIVYYAELPDLATNGTNWCLQKHPQLYLYATMIEARHFVKAGTWQEWNERYMDARRELEQQSDYFNFGGPLAVSVG